MVVDPRAPGGVQMIKLPPESPELRERLDRAPIECELVAHVPKVFNVRARYPRAYVLGFHFDAPQLLELDVMGIQMEHYEQLVVSPVPAHVFNAMQSLILPVAHAALGLDLKLRSKVTQTAIVRVHFSECKRGEPRA